MIWKKKKRNEIFCLDVEMGADCEQQVKKSRFKQEQEVKSQAEVSRDVSNETMEDLERAMDSKITVFCNKSEN